MIDVRRTPALAVVAVALALVAGRLVAAPVGGAACGPDGTAAPCCAPEGDAAPAPCCVSAPEPGPDAIVPERATLAVLPLAPRLPDVPVRETPGRSEGPDAAPRARSAPIWLLDLSLRN